MAASLRLFIGYSGNVYHKNTGNRLGIELQEGEN